MIIILRTLLLLAALGSQQLFALPALWQVADASGVPRAYLMGSIHYGDDSLYPLPDFILNRFDQCHSLVVEINTLELSSTEVGSIFRRLGYYQDQRSVMGMLDGTAGRELESLASRYNIAIGQAKPWLLSMQLASAHLQSLGVDQDLGVDQYFLQRANGQMPIVSLETMEEQLSAFNQLPETDQVHFLNQTLKQFEGVDNHFSELLSAWWAGNDAELSRLLEEGIRQGPPSLAESIFYRRNRVMAERLHALLEGDPGVRFVVVGAGHLVGEQSVNYWLDRKGYRVRRVQY